MPSLNFAKSLFALLVALATLPCGWAQTYSVLYSFTAGTDGAFPSSGVILDSSGNLYGTTAGWATGTVFEVSPAGQFTLLHSFTLHDGYDWPFSALARDSSGNLYGTIYYGGTYGLGEVYKLNPNGDFSVLYSFPDTWFAAGSGPLAAPLIDASGNLYGAGGGGKFKCNGGNNCGVVFKIDPSGDETLLHAFQEGKNGAYPNAGLIRDAAGNLYGTTWAGDKGGNGVVFKLDESGNETLLYSFQNKAGGIKPEWGLIQDAAGNFYGTTPRGGVKGCGNYEPPSCGVIFRLDTNGNETVLYAFTGKSDGGVPSGPVIMDAAGNLYGTAQSGGSGFGVIFKLTPSGKETVLYSFTGGTDGIGPVGGLAMDSAGNLYGTTYSGGNPNYCEGYGCGVVFKLTP